MQQRLMKQNTAYVQGHKAGDDNMLYGKWLQSTQTR